MSKAAILLPALLLAACGVATRTTDEDGGSGGDVDLAGGGSNDDAAPGGAPDLAGSMGGSRDMATMGQPGTVGPTGGKVSRLLFGVTGDTRPMNCDDVANYPTATITKIFSSLNGAGVQFALATGDHQYVCNGGYAGGVQQLGLYAQAAKSLQNKVVFPVMGNHECNETSFCTPGTTLGRFRAYEDTLLKPNWTLPYYSFDVATDLGLARFVVAADTAWDAAEQQWLDQTLSAAAQQAKYVFVFRHYPLGTIFMDQNVDPSLMAEEAIIKKYRYTLLITGHTHEYKHAAQSREIVMGLGGAPLTGNATYYGYLTVAQQADASLAVSVFDVANGNATDTFSVQP